MLRGVKKFAYGLFYLLIITLIVWGVISLVSPSKEEGAEIGESYFSVNVVEGPRFFQLDSGETSFLVKFGNPNGDAEVSFSYKFVASGKSGKMGEIRGSDFLSPDSEEFVSGFGNFEEEIKEVEVETFDEVYNPAAQSLREDVAVSGLHVEVGEERARIAGTLENKGVLSLPRVKIIGILADEFGFRLFAGSTVLEDVESFGEKNFEIFVPVDEKLKGKVDTTSTQVFVNLE